MGRGKVEMKRIEDKSSRQVTFSKRKGGLMKKARELSVLCDVDVAMIIFSGGGKLYEFSSGDSLRQILDRYHVHKDAEVTIPKHVYGNKNHQAENKVPCTGASLLQLVPRHLEEKNVAQLNMTQLVQLERQLDSILRQARNRKMKLMAEAVAALHQKEFQLAQENRQMQQEITAMTNEEDIANQHEQGVVRGLDLNNHVTNNTSMVLPPLHLPQGGMPFIFQKF